VARLCEGIEVVVKPNAKVKVARDQRLPLALRRPSSVVVCPSGVVFPSWRRAGLITNDASAADLASRVRRFDPDGCGRVVNAQPGSTYDVIFIGADGTTARVTIGEPDNVKWLLSSISDTRDQDGALVAIGGCASPALFVDIEAATEGRGAEEVPLPGIE